MIDIVADEGRWTKGIETKRKSSRRVSFIYLAVQRPCREHTHARRFEPFCHPRPARLVIEAVDRHDCPSRLELGPLLSPAWVEIYLCPCTKDYNERPNMQEAAGSEGVESPV